MKTIYEELYQTLIYEERYKLILEGLKNTVIIALGAAIIGLLLGFLISLIRDNYEKNQKMPIINFFCKAYVLIIRGTPVLLQLMIIYYIIFKSVNVNPILVGIVAFGLNSAAYVSEIVRSGLQAINIGQLEAGLSLGLSYRQTMTYVIIPQVIHNIIPSLGNEVITLVKETSVIGYIGVMELTKSSDIIASRTYDYFFPLIIIALIYLALTTLMSKLLHAFERTLNND